MKIKYVGGRSWLKVTLNRKSYIFTKENGRMLDITDQLVINHILSLPNRAEFTVMETPRTETPIVVTNKLKCGLCEFIAKSEQGLLVHSARHRKEDK